MLLNAQEIYLSRSMHTDDPHLDCRLNQAVTCVAIHPDTARRDT